MLWKIHKTRDYQGRKLYPDILKQGQLYLKLSMMEGINSITRVIYNEKSLRLFGMIFIPGVKWWIHRSSFYLSTGPELKPSGMSSLKPMIVWLLLCPQSLLWAVRLFPSNTKRWPVNYNPKNIVGKKTVSQGSLCFTSHNSPDIYLSPASDRCIRE